MNHLTGYSLFLILLAALSGTIQAEYKTQPCDIEFNGLKLCSVNKNGHAISAELLMKAIADDEKQLISITIKRDGKTHKLEISPDVTVLAGDIGDIRFNDINFDGIPDTSITTSFGAPNLYLDYWVYIPESKSYQKLGNYSVFELDPKTKTISTMTKINAASYKNVKYKWDGYKLVETQ